LVDNGRLSHFGEGLFDDTSLFLVLLVLLDAVEHGPNIEVSSGKPFMTALLLFLGKCGTRKTTRKHFRQFIQVSGPEGRIEVLSAQAFVDETKVGICVLRF